MFGIDFTYYIYSFMAIASIYVLAMISPGPDIALTIRNSLLHSRKVGMAGAFGTTTGMCIHLTYTVFGIGYIVVEIPWLMTLIRFAGAAYLIYLGYLSFRSNGKSMEHLNVNINDNDHLKKTLTPWKAYGIGVLNNLLNPMVILLFIGILSSYLTPETPLLVQSFYGIMMVVITLLWFSFVAVFFSVDKVRLQFLRLGKWLERLTGGALIAFGLKVAYLATRAF